MVLELLLEDQIEATSEWNALEQFWKGIHILH